MSATVIWVDDSLTDTVRLVVMTLAEYLEESGATRAEAAEALGVSQVTVHRYLKEGAIPNREVMPRLVKWSNGKVTPNDFYELPKSRKRA